MRFTLLAIFLCGATVLAPFPSLADEKALVAAGVPELGRPWHGGDYTLAAAAVTSGKTKLPSFATADGRMFLRRLLAQENLTMYGDDTLPLGGRLRLYLEVSAALVAIEEKYVAAANEARASKILLNSPSVHAETAEVAAFMLRVAAVGVRLCDEYVPTIPRDDQYAERMAGLKEMQVGTTQAFDSAEVTLSEKPFFSEQDLSVLLEAMADTLPTIKRVFPAGHAAELRKKLEADKPRFTQPKDVQNLQKMIAELGK